MDRGLASVVFLPKDEAFANALGRGLARFAKMVGAEKVDVRTIQPRRLRAHVQQILKL